MHTIYAEVHEVESCLNVKLNNLLKPVFVASILTLLNFQLQELLL
jgi:hypothetical protein